MLDIQELEPRSGETCIVRQLDRAALERIHEASKDLALQNERIVEVISRWTAEDPAA